MTSPNVTDDRLLTTADVARQPAIDENSVRHWLFSGRLRGYRPGGPRLG